MDSNNCKYHPHTHPTWACDTCDANLCGACVPFGHAENWGRAGPRCVICNKSVTFLGEQTENKPAFWTMLPHFFKYPLQSNSLMVIAFAAFLALIAQSLGIFFIILSFIIMSILVKYGFAIIQSRADNHTEAPAASVISQSGSDNLFIKLIIVTLIFYGVIFYISTKSLSLGTVLGGLVTFIMPAVTIILAIEKSIARAVNPLLIITFILRIGWAYLLMWLCYEIVIGGPTYILGLFDDTVPSIMIFPAMIAISAYFWFSANCMLGYTVYQYGSELGYFSPIPEEETLKVDKNTFEKKRLLAEAFILMRENKMNEARKRIRPLLDRIKDDIEIHDFYHKILALCEDLDALKNHADYFIEMLTRKKYIDQAAKVFLDTQAKISNYKITNVESAFRIAENMNNKGSKKYALRVLLDLHKYQPKSPFIAPAYLLAAKLSAETFSKVDRAKKLIEFILKNYPNAEIRNEILDYNELLKKLNV